MTNSMPLALHARGARLGFLCSLAQAGPPGLWAMLQAEGVWQKTVRDDLTWLVQDGGTWPALTAASWPEWWRLLRHEAQWVKKQTNKRLQTAFAAYGRHHRQTLALWVMYKELETACRGSVTEPQYLVLPDLRAMVRKEILLERSTCSKATAELPRIGVGCRARSAVPVARTFGRRIDWQSTCAIPRDVQRPSPPTAYMPPKSATGLVARHGGAGRSTSTLRQHPGRSSRVFPG